MKYAIIGSGKIGTALARVFARKNIEVAIANSRGPETLTPLAKELGATHSSQIRGLRLRGGDYLPRSAVLCSQGDRRSTAAVARKKSLSTP